MAESLERITSREKIDKGRNELAALQKLPE